MIQVTQNLLQAHSTRGCETDGVIGAGSSHVGQLLALADIDHQVVVFFVLADDHSCVNLFPGSQE